MPIVISAVLLVLAILVYVRHLRTAWWLLVLRLIVVLLLAGVLVDAVISHEWSVRPRRVVMLVDRSQSMEVVGADTMAQTAVEGFPLPEGIRRECWVFGDSMERVQGVKGSRGQGDTRTRVGKALRIAVRTEPGAIVIFSDGQDNGELDPVDIVREAGIPVYTVGCGPVGFRNLEVTGITAPAVVYAGDTVGVYGRLRYCGMQGEEIKARMNRGFKKVVLRDEKAESERSRDRYSIAEQELFFRVLFRNPGRQLVRFSVDSLPGESDYSDNQHEIVVDVRPTRIRVAYVTNRPGPGVRFMTRALAQEPRIELKKAMALVPGARLRTGEAGPTDVFVLDGVSTTGTDAQVWENIVQQVRDGAGILILAGPDFRPGKILQELLPGKGEVRSRSGSFPPRPTSAARLLSWLAEIDYDEVRPFTDVHESVGAKGGASLQVWLTAGDPAVPVVVAYRVGKGKAVYVAGHPIWRWGFGPDIAAGKPSPLETFLNGTVRYLAEKDADNFRLEPDKAAFLLGEPVRLKMRARAPDGKAWTGLDVAVVVDSAESQVPMREKGGGVYEVDLPVLGPGTHYATASVSIGDSVLGKTRTSFVVSEREIELAETGLNRELMASIAEASGGMFFRWDSLPGQGFEPALATIKRGFHFEPRRTPWVYVLLALVAGAEWFLRRRRGLM